MGQIGEGTFENVFTDRVGHVFLERGSVWSGWSFGLAAENTVTSSQVTTEITTMPAIAEIIYPKFAFPRAGKIIAGERRPPQTFELLEVLAAQNSNPFV